MLVKFNSSETGEILMFGKVALDLLRLAGKDVEAGQGAFLLAEMLPAAQNLRAAVSEQAEKAASTADEGDDEVKNEEEKAVQPGLAQRAWPLIDMLERTARCGDQAANILWHSL